MSVILNPTDPRTSVDNSDGGLNIRGFNDNDRLNGSGGPDLIRGKRGDDAISGLNGDDRIFGDRGDDSIQGDQGDDTIRGGQGNDTLHGNVGDDVLTGDSGSRFRGSGSGASGVDVFLFGEGLFPNAVVLPADVVSLGNDTVTDFQSGEDKIAFSAVTFGFAVPAPQPLPGAEFAVVENASIGTVDLQTARIVYDQGTGALYYNRDAAAPTAGNVNVIQIAQLTNAPTVLLTDLEIF